MEDIKTEEIASLLKQELTDLNIDLDIAEVGEVIYVGDGVSRIQGLENVLSSELLEFPNNVFTSFGLKYFLSIFIIHFPC